MVGYALQQIIQLFQHREIVFAGVNDGDPEVWRGGGTLLEGGTWFPDIERRADVWIGRRVRMVHARIRAEFLAVRGRSRIVCGYES